MTRLTSFLEKEEQLAEKATRGPWFNGYWSGQCHMKHAHGRGSCNYEYTKQPSKRLVSAAQENVELVGYDDYGPILNEENAAFIANARTAIPKLIALVRVLSGACEFVSGGGGLSEGEKSDAKFLLNIFQLNRERASKALAEAESMVSNE